MNINKIYKYTIKITDTYCKKKVEYFKVDFDENFEEVIYTDISHIEDKVIEMKKLMDGSKIPEVTPHCQNCNYIIAGGKLINKN